MGQRLKGICDAIMSEGGMKAKMRLPVSTGIPEAKALELPDSQDNVDKFVKAFKQITGKDAPQ